MWMVLRRYEPDFNPYSSYLGQFWVLLKACFSSGCCHNFDGYHCLPTGNWRKTGEIKIRLIKEINNFEWKYVRAHALNTWPNKYNLWHSSENVVWRTIPPNPLFLNGYNDVHSEDYWHLTGVSSQNQIFLIMKGANSKLLRSSLLSVLFLSSLSFLLGGYSSGYQTVVWLWILHYVT